MCVLRLLSLPQLLVWAGPASSVWLWRRVAEQHSHHSLPVAFDTAPVDKKIWEISVDVFIVVGSLYGQWEEGEGESLPSADLEPQNEVSVFISREHRSRFISWGGYLQLNLIKKHRFCFWYQSFSTSIHQWCLLDSNNIFSLQISLPSTCRSFYI